VRLFQLSVFCAANDGVSPNTNTMVSKTVIKPNFFETVLFIKKLLSPATIPVHPAKPLGKNQGLAGLHHRGAFLSAP
jgi:hypothetical protein